MSDEINVTIATDTISVTSSLQNPNPSYVDSDVRFNFDGASGDTYIVYNSTSGKLEVVVDGTKKFEF